MRRRGFTLIELLVVIAIIALLIGILLPALSRSRLLGRRTVTLAHLRDIGVGTLAYAQHNDDRFPALLDPEEKAFFGLSLLARVHQLPVKVFINPNTDDTAATAHTEDDRPVLADIAGAEITEVDVIDNSNVDQVRWHCSYAYDNDVKKINDCRIQVFLGDRADYSTGTTYSANWQGEDICVLWTDGHGIFTKHNYIWEQGDPNMYHHNEYDGEGGDEVNGPVVVTPRTLDTHLRFFSEEEDDALLPN